MTTPRRPLILVRGFGGIGIGDDQANAYQGFNDGTVYPDRRGENYIYEGFVLRALKSPVHPYRDATNVVAYHPEPVSSPPPPDGVASDDVTGTVVLDPAVADHVLAAGTAGTIWIYRYYDLRPRTLARYAEGLVRLIGLIERSAARRGETFTGVDIVAHSMGGLITRDAIIAMDAERRGSARERVHRVVTLGTPHRGIAFQRLPEWLVQVLPGVRNAGAELAAFDPTKTTFRQWATAFDVRRVLCIVGTDYRSYDVAVSSALNRVSSLFDEGSATYNRSDGLVKHSSAQLPGAPRTFVHKPHGGRDSLVTARESYEIAMRFLHGTHHVRLSLDDAQVTRGRDVFGRSEFYLGVAIKPRFVDFDLFHQSTRAENAYGPFHEEDLGDPLPDLATELNKPLADAGDRTTGWAGPGRLIWEGWIDATTTRDDAQGLVFRLDVAVSERDSFGIGFSDNVVFRKQYYVQAFPGSQPQPSPRIFVHAGERYLWGENARDATQLSEVSEAGPAAAVQEAVPDTAPGAFTFQVGGTGFAATLRIAIAPVPPD